MICNSRGGGEIQKKNRIFVKQLYSALVLRTPFVRRTASWIGIGLGGLFLAFDETGRGMGGVILKNRF